MRGDLRVRTDDTTPAVAAVSASDDMAVMSLLLPTALCTLETSESTVPYSSPPPPAESNVNSLVDLSPARVAPLDVLALASPAVPFCIPIADLGVAPLPLGSLNGVRCEARPARDMDGRVEVRFIPLPRYLASSESRATAREPPVPWE